MNIRGFCSTYPKLPSLIKEFWHDFIPEDFVGPGTQLWLRRQDSSIRFTRPDLQMTQRPTSDSFP